MKYVSIQQKLPLLSTHAVYGLGCMIFRTKHLHLASLPLALYDFSYKTITPGQVCLTILSA